MTNFFLFILILLNLLVIFELWCIVWKFYYGFNKQPPKITRFILGLRGKKPSSKHFGSIQQEVKSEPGGAFEQNKAFADLSHVLQNVSKGLHQLDVNLRTQLSTSTDSFKTLNRTVQSLQDFLKNGTAQDRQNSKELFGHLSELMIQLDELVLSIKAMLTRPSAVSTVIEPQNRTPQTIPRQNTLEQKPSSPPQQKPQDNQIAAIGRENTLMAEGRNKSEVQPVYSSQYSSEEGTQRFKRLRDWMDSNIQYIMRRSMVEWQTPEELLEGAPKNLYLTSQILDQKILLVGTQDYDQQLAMVLPGSYIGASYFDWFILPKGTNERVEETVESAIVEKVNGEFTVVQRGQIRQD